MDTAIYSFAAVVTVLVAVQVTRPTTIPLLEQWVPKHEVATVGVDDDVYFQPELIAPPPLSIIFLYIYIFFPF